jgi:hypothetical protein
LGGAVEDSPGVRLRNVCRQLAGGNGVGCDRTAGAGIDILLFGAGKYTARLLTERQTWERDGHRVMGIIDDDPRFAATPIYLGLPVRSLLDVEMEASNGKPMPAVVLSTDTFIDQLWERTARLRLLGVQVAHLGDAADRNRKAA